MSSSWLVREAPWRRCGEDDNDRPPLSDSLLALDWSGPCGSYQHSGSRNCPTHRLNDFPIWQHAYQYGSLVCTRLSPGIWHCYPPSPPCLWFQAILDPWPRRSRWNDGSTWRAPASWQCFARFPFSRAKLSLLGWPPEYITTKTAPRPGSRILSTTDLDTPPVHHLSVRQHGGLELVVGVVAGARRHARRRSDEPIMLQLRRGLCQRRPLQHRWRV